VEGTLLDVLLRQHPELDEREARGRILRGDVLVGDTRLTRPGARVPPDASIHLRLRPRFVSRAGEKLDAALERLAMDVRDRTIIDAGSATGGFTDCLLARGAALVYSVDVGRSLLAWRLRRDPRVRVMERTNVMSLDAASLVPCPDGAVCDLSFRSILGAASHLVALAREGWLLALVKPQFEWRQPSPGFRGVVQEPEVVLSILADLAASLFDGGLAVTAVCPSPVRGRKGNREFFFLICRSDPALGAPQVLAPGRLSEAVREGLA
jgi:23S rRNA (cytidine1920-2'-O)/16S rRNA (cytidine1409-2'-O)-methyltransferase